ncbi:MAG TPA: NAD(P)/FAD-dependent oxidoreductase [Pseudonocardiaceae bacterium]|nr:NAD(P)/FAD-dependent oxidoreductase [Pseudonocardiaceae bacterium]
MSERDYDVVVVGGGAAGLSGALALARSRRSVLVVDTGRPRNAPAAHMHNYLSRDGLAPLDFLAAGRDEVLGYGGRIVTGELASVRRIGGGFRIRLSDGTTLAARRLLVATGLRDELPDVPGIAERWGRDVLHCPYCHGWEVRDQRVGILATGPMTAHSAQLFRQLTPTVTVLAHTGPELPGTELERLAARGITLVPGKVTGLRVVDDALAGVELADGTTVPLDALVVAPRLTATVPAALDLPTAEQVVGDTVIATYVPTDATGATDVPGVWAAGNVTNPMEQVGGAAAAGVRAAAAINMDLIEEEIRTAIEDAAPFSARMEREAARRRH